MPRRLLAFLFACLSVLMPASAVLVTLLASPAAAQDGDEPAPPTPDDTIDVLQVSGLLDPIVVDNIVDRLDDVEASGSLALVLQVNSDGSVVSDADLDALLDRLAASTVPIGVWVGPSGSDADGEAARLAEVADLAGLSPGSTIGGQGVNDALAAGVVQTDAAILGEFILALEDEGVLAGISRQPEGVVGREIVPRVRFAKLPLFAQLLHTAASPPVAYLLLLIGLAMVVLDFFTGGVGVAGGVGVISLVLSGYGLSVLNTQLLGVVLLVLAFLAFAVDLQAGIPRFWTAVGAVGLVVGTFTLYDGHSLSWLTWLAGIGLTLVFVLTGMPSLIRTRFSTTTIGRDWMVGEMGEASSDIDPEGIVTVQGAKWKARTNRLTPIVAGAPARVVAIEGVILEVEPETGGAIDYREMRNRRKGAVDGDEGADSEPADRQS